MDAEQIELARHALGLPNRRNTSYRNYFVTGDGSADYPHWMSMVNAGFAARRRGGQLTGGDDIFRLTRAGADRALKRGERLDPEDFQ